MDQKMIEAIIEWLEDHLLEGFSLEKLGEAMGFSPYYCSFKFHQMTGITIKRYRLLRLMFEASQLLIETEMSLIEVALSCGYDSQEAFSRAFKEVNGLSPKAFRLNPRPLQTYHQLSLKEKEGAYLMDISKKMKIEDLQDKLTQQYQTKILNVLNGQMMFQTFAEQQLMGDSTYVPFNEAMCVNETSIPIFAENFQKIRAQGHQVSLASYQATVIDNLQPFLATDYDCVILWFGEDMFCQMNLLTCLAYLEQVGYSGDVYYHAVHEASYDVQETKIKLGHYQKIYQAVLVEHEAYPNVELPVLHQGIKLYLALQKPQNPIKKYIASHLQLNEKELLSQLFLRFPQYGLGDRQYLALIDELKH